MSLCARIIRILGKRSFRVHDEDQKTIFLDLYHASYTREDSIELFGTCVLKFWIPLASQYS